MDLHLLSYEASRGWSTPFPDLDGDDTLVLVFGASSFRTDPAPIAELRRAYPRAILAGCSSSGEIFGDHILDESLSVAVLRFAGTRVRLASAAVDGPADSFEAGTSLRSALDEPELRAMLVLSDGLKVNGSELVEGLKQGLPEHVVVTGGLAGDGDRFEETWVLEGDTPRSGLVASIGFYGDRVRVGHGCRGGWDLFGPERTITRSEGNVLFELDGKPALELYRDYLGERAAGLPATGLLFPLAIREAGSREKGIVRTILGVDETNQSMTFAGDLPQGWRAQLMKANFDRLIDGAANAAELARAGDARSGESPPGESLTIAVSCVGRRLVLGERAEEEVEATLEGSPPGAKQIGFYSYGEVSPHVDGSCDLHNQTMTLTTIRED